LTVFSKEFPIIEQVQKSELREYLLGRLSDEDKEEIEVRLMSDPAYAEEFDMMVMEITDQYGAGEFEGEERKQVENYFFRSPERRTGLKIALGLRKQQAERRRRLSQLRIPLQIAASLIVVAGLAYAFWPGKPAEFNRGIADLRAATQNRRPVQSRLSGLDYAPFPQTRGTEVNPQQERLRLAELNLKAALEKDPTPEVHHALGQTHLAQGKFDEAITHLSQALAKTEAKAQVYSDLGAAWMEKAKVSKHGDSGDLAPPAKDAFARSLENLNNALQLDGNLQEALFNRALVHESLGQVEQAKTDWREYLKRDSTSDWAAEAQTSLQLLESSSSST
jgi:hypothetical protein